MSLNYKDFLGFNSDAVYALPPAIPHIKELISVVEVLLLSNDTVAILSEKTTLTSVTPSFFESLDWIVLAQPISQVIPETAKDTVCISAICRMPLFTSSFFSFFCSSEQDQIKRVLSISDKKIDLVFMIVFYDCFIIQIYAFNDVYLKIYSIFVGH